MNMSNNDFEKLNLNDKKKKFIFKKVTIYYTDTKSNRDTYFVQWESEVIKDVTISLIVSSEVVDYIKEHRPDITMKVSKKIKNKIKLNNAKKKTKKKKKSSNSKKNTKRKNTKSKNTRKKT